MCLLSLGLFSRREGSQEEEEREGGVRGFRVNKGTMVLLKES